MNIQTCPGKPCGMKFGTKVVRKKITFGKPRQVLMNLKRKMSLVPLAHSELLKAAIICHVVCNTFSGNERAVYTAYFMTPALRGKVKPTIEIMAALPTVILGFLAGLWLAPFVENYSKCNFCNITAVAFYDATCRLVLALCTSIIGAIGLGLVGKCYC